MVSPIAFIGSSGFEKTITIEYLISCPKDGFKVGSVKYVHQLATGLINKIISMATRVQEDITVKRKYELHS